MNKLKSTLKRLWQDESAQGATEYILLLVVVVSLAFLFRGQITEFVTGRLGALGEGLNSFNVQNN